MKIKRKKIKRKKIKRIKLRIVETETLNTNWYSFPASFGTTSVFLVTMEKQQSNSLGRCLVWPAIGSLCTGFTAFAGLKVLGAARTKYGLKAPETELSDKHSEEERQDFKRAYRQWMNLIEWNCICQPIFWGSAVLTYEAFGGDSKLYRTVSLMSIIFPFLRIGYGFAYAKAAKARSPWFASSMLTFFVAFSIGLGSTVKIVQQEISGK